MSLKSWYILCIFLSALGILIIALPPKHPPTHLHNSVLRLPPEQALPEIINNNINSKFRQEGYAVKKDDSSLVRFGLGGKFAQNYSDQWTYPDKNIIAFVGYSKKTSAFLGYALNVYHKGIKPDRQILAKKIFTGIPSLGWQHSPPKQQKGFTSQISTVIWYEGETIFYLEDLSLAYQQPKAGYFPGESVQDVSFLRLLAYLPENPEYLQVEEFKQAAHRLYAE